MKQVWLVFRKDCRRLRWPLLLFCGLILAGAWFDLRDPWAFEQNQLAEDLRFIGEDLLISGTIVFAHVLAVIVMVGLVVHQDPLLGTSAYWMTRPLRPIALLGAKAVFVLLFLALFPALVDLGVLMTFGLESSRWLGTLFIGLGVQIPLIFAVALAAVTPNIPVYLIACVAATVAVSLSGLYAGFSIMTSPGGWLGWSLHGLIVLGICILVIWRQYTRSDARVSVVLLTVAMALGPLAVQLPWYRLDPGAAGESLEVSVAPTGEGGYFQVERGYRGGPNLRFSFGAPGAPTDQYLELQYVWGKIRLDDGREIVVANQFIGSVPSNYKDAALKATLPGHSWYGPILESNADTYLTLYTQIDPASISGRTTSFKGQAQLQALSFELAGSLQARGGARLRDGSLAVEVVNGRATPTDFVVDLRYSQIAESASIGNDKIEFLLVRSDRRQAARPRRPKDGESSELWRFRSHSISRLAGTVSLRRLTSIFPLPFDPRSERLEDLELQVWRPIPKKPYSGVIDLPQFRTGK